MATTANLGLTLMNAGDKITTSTINNNYNKIDAAIGGGRGIKDMCFYSSSTASYANESSTEGYAIWTTPSYPGGTQLINNGQTIVVPTNVSAAIINLIFRDGTEIFEGSLYVYVRKNGTNIYTHECETNDSKTYLQFKTYSLSSLTRSDTIEVYFVRQNRAAIIFKNIQCFFL